MHEVHLSGVSVLIQCSTRATACRLMNYPTVLDLSSEIFLSEQSGFFSGHRQPTPPPVRRAPRFVATVLMTFLSPTMAQPKRQPLGSTLKYNERLNRARSHNSMAHKLSEKASPVPRSPAKERPAKDLCARELKQKKDDVASPISANPFLKNNEAKEDEEDVPTFKSNPFLLADKKKKAQPPTAPPLPAKAKSAPTMVAEPRPIGNLTERQREQLRSKRLSITQQAGPNTEQPLLVQKELKSKQEGDQTMDAAEIVSECDVQEETRTTEEDDTEEYDEAQSDDEDGCCVGVQVMPVSEAQAPTCTIAQALIAPDQSVVADVEAVIAPVQSLIAPDQTVAADVEAVLADELAVGVVAKETVGDLPFLKAGTAQPELCAAISSFLPALEAAIARARAVDATAEPLLDVVRRMQRGKSKRKRR